MPGLISILPVLSTIVALMLGAKSLHAALLGVLSAMLAILTAFPLSLEGILPTVLHWAPILTEVLLIVAGGLLLSEVLRQAGGQAALAKWIGARTGQGVGAILLVVHGITPFAESLTGFGVGITIGIPLLMHFRLPAPRVAMIGLLGLCAVPWGSMGPGTLIAATMSDVPFHDLGVASAVTSIVPFTVTGIVAAWIASSAGNRISAVLLGTMSGIVLTIAVTAMNASFGTAPAGALGSLMMIGVHLARGHRNRGKASLDTVGCRALMSYGLLLGGVLVAGWIVNAADLSENWRYVGSPALWLFIAAVWFTGGIPTREVLRKVGSSWLQVAPVTGLFILLGIFMAVSGMAANLARTLAGSGKAYLAVAPFVGAMGGFVTGSNSGANAMFATTQGEIARSLGVNVLWFMAVHNVAAAFLLMASPGKVEMAAQLANSETGCDRSSIQITLLGVALAVIVALAALNVALSVY